MDEYCTLPKENGQREKKGPWTNQWSVWCYFCTLLILLSLCLSLMRNPTDCSSPTRTHPTEGERQSQGNKYAKAVGVELSQAEALSKRNIDQHTPREASMGLIPWIPWKTLLLKLLALKLLAISHTTNHSPHLGPLSRTCVRHCPIVSQDKYRNGMKTGDVWSHPTTRSSLSSSFVFVLFFLYILLCLVSPK